MLKETRGRPENKYKKKRKRKTKRKEKMAGGERTKAENNKRIKRNQDRKRNMTSIREPCCRCTRGKKQTTYTRTQISIFALHPLTPLPFIPGLRKGKSGALSHFYFAVLVGCCCSCAHSVLRENLTITMVRVTLYTVCTKIHVLFFQTSGGGMVAVYIIHDSCWSKSPSHGGEGS